jgi:hypothetical protein
VAEVFNHIATPELDLRHELGMEEEGKTRTPEERGKEWRERKKGEVGERGRREK